MHILVLGGTKFVGRTFVEIARWRGHRVTLLNRGQSSPELFKGLEQLPADRGQDLSLLDGRKFDAVMDTSGYFPRVVEMSARKMKDSVRRYLFISSISVYRDTATLNQKEDAPLAESEEVLPEEVTGTTYSPLKVQCELAVNSVFGSEATIVRPGLIVGPFDTTDRFTYWPVRFSRPGPVLVPDVKDQPVQFIHARDLCSWCVDLLEQDVAGTFNATGPQVPYRFKEVMEACSLNSDIEWVDPEFLAAEHVTPWSDLPLFVSADGSSNGFMSINVDRAVGMGLKLSSLKQIVDDTREWALSRGADYTLKAGLTPEREREVLSKWRAR